MMMMMRGSHYGRINEVGSHYDATRFKHVLHMNTFNSAINQPFYIYFSTLQQQFITTEQNRVHVMRKINNDVFQFLNRIWPLVKCPEEPFFIL